MKKILFVLFLLLTFTKTQAQEGMFDGKWIYDHWTIPDYATYSKPLAFYTLYRCDEVLYGNYEYQFKLFPTDSLSVSANKVQGLKAKTDSYGYALSASTYTKTESDGRFKPLSYQPTYASLPDKPAIPTNTNQLINGAGYLTNYTETDPLWISDKPNYRTKSQNDALYQPIGTYLTKSVADTFYYPLTGNPSGFLTSFSGKTTTDLAEGTNQYFTNTRSRNSFSLTTNGTSGQSTYDASTGIFNIPNYNLSVLARVFSNPTFLSSTTATQLSTTRDSNVSYSYDASIAITVLGGQGITAILTYADNSAMTTNPVVVDSNGIATSGLAGLSQTQTITVKGWIPAGKFRRVTFELTRTGTATFPSAPTTIKSGQEILN